MPALFYPLYKYTYINGTLSCWIDVYLLSIQNFHYLSISMFQNHWNSEPRSFVRSQVVSDLKTWSYGKPVSLTSAKWKSHVFTTNNNYLASTFWFWNGWPRFANAAKMLNKESFTQPFHSVFSFLRIDFHPSTILIPHLAVNSEIRGVFVNSNPHIPFVLDRDVMMCKNHNKTKVLLCTRHMSFALKHRYITAAAVFSLNMMK